MTPESPKPPREWWIELDSDLEGRTEFDRIWREMPYSDYAIHVIEHSAYLALEKENAEQENELRSLRDELTMTRAENSNLIEERERLRLALERICSSAGMPCAQDACRTVIIIARKALGG